MFKNLACKLHVCKLSKLEEWKEVDGVFEYTYAVRSCPKCGRKRETLIAEVLPKLMKQTFPPKGKKVVRKAPAKKTASKAKK